MALQTEQQADKTYCRQASQEPDGKNWTLANAITPDRPGNKRREGEDEDRRKQQMAENDAEAEKKRCI